MFKWWSVVLTYDVNRHRKLQKREIQIYFLYFSQHVSQNHIFMFSWSRFRFHTITTYDLSTTNWSNLFGVDVLRATRWLAKSESWKLTTTPYLKEFWAHRTWSTSKTPVVCAALNFKHIFRWIKNTHICFPNFVSISKQKTQITKQHFLWKTSN
jgi:hypothetical protein